MDQETNSNAKTGQGQVLLPSNCVSLQPFIKKLGHDVEEIRVRAFKNILFKLDHKLVCAADLVQEKKLLINLLEWFNFPNAPMKKEVLRILKTLSKPVSGAKGLLSIGAIEFLSHLRQDVDPELYQSVDNVIHQLLSFPQEDAAGHDQRCLYKEHNPVEQIQDHSGSEQSSGHPGSNRKLAKEQSMQSASPVIAQPFALKNGIHPHYDTKSATGFFEEQKGSGEKAHSSAISAIKIQSLHGTDNSSRSFNESKSNLTFVPWMPLSTSDRNILSVTASRLQSRSQSLISNSCEFLRDVLFKDFPAEIFLQRPSLLQSLLEFLEDKTHVVDDPSVVLAVTQCLCDLSCHLHVRLKSLSDSVLFCHDQDCWKHRHIMAEIKNKGSDGQLVDARETGDGGDSDKSSSSSLSDNKASQASDEDDDNEDETVTEALQFNQLSLEEFCMIVLSRVTPVFKGSLCNVPSIIESSINLLHEVLSLMKNFFPANLWMSRMQVNSVMAASLTNIMKILGESIVHHMKYYIQLFHDDDKERDFKPLKHRLLVHRMTVVNLSTFLLQFLDSLVPLEMSSKVIPSELTTVLWFLSMDELLAKTHNHLQPIAMKYLAAVDQHSNELSLFTEDICESMVNTCKFLKACKVKELGGSLKELADLLEASVPSLTYHRHMEFIHEALMICSKVCDPATVADERVIAICQRAVLHLLAHSNSDVRWQAYKVSWSLAKEALSVSHVTEPMSIVCQKSLFLLDKAVLHQICCFGIYDENEKVHPSACVQAQLRSVDDEPMQLRVLRLNLQDCAAVQLRVLLPRGSGSTASPPSAWFCPQPPSRPQGMKLRLAVDGSGGGIKALMSWEQFRAPRHAEELGAVACAVQHDFDRGNGPCATRFQVRLRMEGQIWEELQPQLLPRPRKDVTQQREAESYEWSLQDPRLATLGQLEVQMRHGNAILWSSWSESSRLSVGLEAPRPVGALLLEEVTPYCVSLCWPPFASSAQLPLEYRVQCRESDNDRELAWHTVGVLEATGESDAFLRHKLKFLRPEKSYQFAIECRYQSLPAVPGRLETTQIQLGPRQFPNSSGA